MSLLLEIHPVNPQPRLIRRAVDIVRAGGVVVYPTDSCYAIGCQLGDKDAMERIRTLRKLPVDHHFTLMCRNLAEISTYALLDNIAFRLIKANTPGAYTFILQASREVPRRLLHPKRKTIGLRLPNHPIVLALLEELGEPLLSATLLLPGHTLPLSEPHEIAETLHHNVDLVIDGGPGGLEPTTVVDVVEGEPVVVRVGKGDATPFR